MKGKKEGRVTRDDLGHRAFVAARSPGLPVGERGRENARAHGHARSLTLTNGMGSSQSARPNLSLLPPSFVRRATLGAALSPPIRTDDDVAVKLVGSEGKDLREGNVRDGLAHGKRGDHHEICERVA